MLHFTDVLRTDVALDIYAPLLQLKLNKNIWLENILYDYIFIEVLFSVYWISF
jgi:hypothetical protein